MERVWWSGPDIEKKGAREGERKRDWGRGGPNKQIILFSTHNGKWRNGRAREGYLLQSTSRWLWEFLVYVLKWDFGRRKKGTPRPQHVLLPAPPPPPANKGHDVPCETPLSTSQDGNAQNLTIQPSHVLCPRGYSENPGQLQCLSNIVAYEGIWSRIFVPVNWNRTPALFRRRV